MEKRETRERSDLMDLVVLPASRESKESLAYVDQLENLEHLVCRAHKGTLVLQAKLARLVRKVTLVKLAFPVATEARDRKD